MGRREYYMNNWHEKHFFNPPHFVLSHSSPNALTFFFFIMSIKLVTEKISVLLGIKIQTSLKKWANFALILSSFSLPVSCFQPLNLQRAIHLLRYAVLSIAAIFANLALLFSNCYLKLAQLLFYGYFLNQSLFLCRQSPANHQIW